MDTVTTVKARIATLADNNRRLAADLEAKDRELTKLRRQCDELLREVDHADRERQAFQDELLQDRRSYEQLVHEREALIRDLDAARRQLVCDLDAERRQLAEVEDRFESFAERLCDAENERDDVACELGEATSAFVDIREKLRLTLGEVTSSGLEQVSPLQ